MHGQRLVAAGRLKVMRQSADMLRLCYAYDFGDHRQHEIVIEKRLKHSKRNAVPVCLGGAMHRPPEDVGGIGGYGHFLEAISDKNDPEGRELLAWAQKDTKGRMSDPEYFYVDEVNEKLKYVLEDTPEAARNLLAAPGGLVGLQVTTSRKSRK